MRGEPTDARSDLFSLGVILYEMASGKRAFRGTSSVEVMNSILKDEPPELPPASPPCAGSDRAPVYRKAAGAQVPVRRRPRLRAAILIAIARARGAAQTQSVVEMGGTGGIAVTAGAVYWLGLRPRRASAPPETTLRRLTNDSRVSPRAPPFLPMASWSPTPADGDIWVQQVDGGGSIRITDDPLRRPTRRFLRMGPQIAFRSEREGGGIYIAPALGGEARELVPEGRRPRFSPDGRWLMYWIGPSRANRRLRDTKLFVRPLSGGTATQIGAGILRLMWLEYAGLVAGWEPDSVFRVHAAAMCRPAGFPLSTERT